MDEYVRDLTETISGRLRVPPTQIFSLIIRSDKFLKCLVESAEFREYYLCPMRITPSFNSGDIHDVIKTMSPGLISKYFSYNKMYKIRVTTQPFNNTSCLCIEYSYGTFKWSAGYCFMDCDICELNGKLAACGFKYQKTDGREHHFKYPLRI